MRTKTTITTEIIERVYQLAATGFNNIQIGRSLNLAVQTLSQNKDVKEAIQRGKLELSYKVTQSVLDTLEQNPTTQQLLIKRLCLFNPIIEIKKPASAKDAIENLAAATKLYAKGEINESQLKTIEAVCNSYAKVTEIIDLESRLSKLEELAADGK